LVRFVGRGWRSDSCLSRYRPELDQVVRRAAASTRCGRCRLHRCDSNARLQGHAVVDRRQRHTSGPCGGLHTGDLATVTLPACFLIAARHRPPTRNAGRRCPVADRSTGMPLGSCLPFQVTPGGDGLFVRRQSVRVSCLDVCLASSDAPLVLWAFMDQDLNLIQDLTRSSRPQNAYQ
jgi:hypothetical protein